MTGASPAGADPVPADIQPLLDDALDLARQAIANPACADRLNGSREFLPPDSALLVLRDVKTEFTADPPPPLPSNAAASTDFGSFTVKPITIHRNFPLLTGEVPDQNGDTNSLLYLGDLRIPVTGRIDRVVAILHEVGHLTARETHQPLGNPNQAGISETERQRRQDAANRAEGQYNAEILNTCVAPLFLPPPRQDYVPISIVAILCAPFNPFIPEFARAFICEARWTGGDEFEVDVRPDNLTYPSGDFSVDVPGRTVRFRMDCPPIVDLHQPQTDVITAGVMIRDFDSSRYDFEFTSGDVAASDIVCRYAPFPPIEW